MRKLIGFINTNLILVPNPAQQAMHGKFTKPKIKATNTTDVRSLVGAYTLTAVNAIVHALGFTHWKSTASTNVMGCAFAFLPSIALDDLAILKARYSM